MPIVPRSADRWLLQRIFRFIGPAPVRIGLKGGESVSPSAFPVAAATIPDYRTLAQLLVDSEVAFAEAYADGRIEIDGDLPSFLDAVYASSPEPPALARWYFELQSRWLDWRQNNSLLGSRSNIHRHYDLGNDFYKLWLDRELLYTCAYFPSPSATLEEAQRAKMDYVCRKLGLAAGESVVEAGCGWGALALYMARHYGVRVKAFNVSHEQIVLARERARNEGLDGLVEFIEDDYRNISGKFDVFVSVGMLEHVGRNHHAEFSQVIHRAVGDSGRGLIHFIGRNQPAGASRWIRKRIFPGSHSASLREALQILERWNYTVLDVENLRHHYAKTLEHWLDRYEKAQGEISAAYDEWFRRAWRMYLAGTMAGFRRGTMQLYQIVFAGSRRDPIHWTRAPLYAAASLDEPRSQWTHAMS